MNNKSEIDIEHDPEARTAENIMLDFVYALDEAAATYKILEKITEEDPRPNQLLFCHIINNFDSFVDSLLMIVILSNKDRLKEYLKKGKRFEEKPSLEEIICMHENGIYEWMKMQAEGILEEDLRRKRHSQKLELLLENSGIDFKNIYVYLTGPGKHSSGCFRKNPTPKEKKSTNHKTTSEKLIGYADILYEKRNAITHNRNEYSKNEITRLNSTWGIEIVRKAIFVRHDTIKALFRFYTSIGLEIIERNGINYASQSSQLKTYLGTLKEGKNIKLINDGKDLREKGGGIDERKKILINSYEKSITLKKYITLSNISSATASKDFKKFIKQGIIKKGRGDKYKINTPNR